MLILTRRVGETLMIGDEVTVTVLGVKEIRCVSVLTHLKRFLFTVKKSINVSNLKNRVHHRKVVTFNTALWRGYYGDRRVSFLTDFFIF